MKTKLSVKIISLISAIVISFTVVAEDATAIEIPMLENAIVFAEFTDKLPAVVNYFTSATEEEVIAFYQERYGEVEHQERKRGRLTQYYADEKNTIRVVISQQNNKRQVDILVEKS